MKAYMGIDIGGTSIKAGVVDENGEVLDNEKIGLPQTWDLLKAWIKQFYEEKRRSYVIVGLGLSTPGTVDPDTGFISGIPAPAVRYILGKSFFELEEELKIPVAIEQDANCSAIGEFWVGNAIGLKNVVVMVLGSGLGGCIFINGKHYAGTNLYAGDFGYGYRTYDDQSSISSYVAPVFVERQYKQRTGRFLTIPQMYESKDNDPVAKHIYEGFITNIANLIYLLQYVLDPEIFLIGGGISEWSPLIGQIENALDCMIKSRKSPLKPKVNSCKNGNGSNIIGAVYNLKIRESI